MIIIKFLIFLLGALFFLTLILGVKTVGRILKFLFGPKRTYSNTYRSSQQTQSREPETQEERIISYQKKNFESSEPEDAEFEEIK